MFKLFYNPKLSKAIPVSFRPFHSFVCFGVDSIKIFAIFCLQKFEKLTLKFLMSELEIGNYATS